MALVDEVIKEVSEKNSNEQEFIQAVTEVWGALRPVVDADDRYEKNAIFSKIICFNTSIVLLVYLLFEYWCSVL